QNEELQALYKKHNANPMGGCLPILLQMPFFFAFYKLLTVAIEMRQAEWLWVSDLSNPETLPIRVLPLAMVATQFWSQSLTPTPTTDAMQARMMKFMPLVFGFIFYQFQAGLVLYWLTSNCVGIVQQLVLNRLPQEQLELDRKPRRGKRKKRGKQAGAAPSGR
ncbi:MAG: membrane protein insertase YidC, partial [Bryobacterales bacterium]|nr:membrane protein insertase YidC [Bryobacterales bacterium]